jgi:hypothetical protein
MDTSHHPLPFLSFFRFLSFRFSFPLVDPDVKSRVTEAIGNDKPKILTADVIMISGCEDQQTSADVSNVA